MAYRTTSWKNTDIGTIPSDWSIANLSDICDNYTGLTYSPKSVSESGTLVLRSSNIKQGRLSFYDNVFVKMEIPSRAMAHDGDVLVCVRNGSAKLIGKSAKVVGNGMAFGAFMTVLRAKKCSPEFLLFLWQSFYIQEQIKITLGATINQITNGDIKNFVVPVPSTIPEQQKIAEILTDIEDLITELERVRDKKIAVKTGAMQELLKPKDGWVSTTLKDVMIFRNGYPFKSDTYDNHGKYKVITIANVQQGKMQLYNVNHISLLPSDIQSYQVLKSGDIILSMTGNVGRTCIVVDDNCLLNQRVGKIEPNANIDRLFLYMILQNDKFVKGMMGVAQGGAQANLSLSDIQKYTFYMPTDKAEQTAIAQILSDMDDEISAISDKINKYKQIKSGVAGELLSGRIRLVKPQE